jgi:hypothetical protein
MTTKTLPTQVKRKLEKKSAKIKRTYAVHGCTRLRMQKTLTLKLTVSHGEHEPRSRYCSMTRASASTAVMRARACSSWYSARLAASSATISCKRTD